MATSNFTLNNRITQLAKTIADIPPPSGDQNLISVLNTGNNAGGLSITNLNNLGVSTINGSVYPPIIPTDTLTSVLIAGNSAGASNINMNNNDILNVDNINLSTINNSVYPPVIPTDTLQEVIDNGDELQGSVPTLDQVIKYDGTNIVWSDLPEPTATPSLQEVINVSDELQSTAPTVGQFIGYNGGTTVWSDLPVVTLDSVVVESPQLNGSQPTTNQVIQFDGEFVVWADLPEPTLDSVVVQSPELDGSQPTINQVIQYDGEFVVWADLPDPPATPNLNQVLTSGHTAIGTSAIIELLDSAPPINYNTITPSSIQMDDNTTLERNLLSTTGMVLDTNVSSGILGFGSSLNGTNLSFTDKASTTNSNLSRNNLYLKNTTKENTVSSSSVFLNNTSIVEQTSLNSDKLRLLTSLITNDITSTKMSIIKPSTSSISEYGTDGLSLTGLIGAETRSASFNLTSGTTINNATTKLSGTMNEAFVSLDGNTTSSALGNKSTLNASGLTCVNKVTPSTTSSLSATALNLGITGTTLTVSPTGLSSTNILNLNSTSQIDTNCSIRVLAVPPSSAGRAILSNSQLVMQNVASALQNTIASTSSAITNGTKTITMTVDGISSNGAMSLGTATVNLTSGSSGITQTYPSNTTALATTQYVTTAISNIPASAIPTLQSVTNQGNTITNGTKTLTLSVNGLDSTGEIAINNNTGTTRIRGTSTIDNINSTNYDTIGTDLTTKLLNSLTTGNLEIGNNMTTGSINFGSKMTSGNLFIMNDALATGDITMFNNSSSATGKLKVRGGGIQTKEIEASSGIKSLTYNGLSALNDLDIGDNVVNKTISIGRLMTTGGIVNIGAGLSDINLLAINSTAITQTTGNNSNRIATTAFVNSSIAVIPVPSLQQVLNAGNTANLGIILSDGTITTTLTKNSIVGTDDLTINAAATKLLKIGSGSATENVEIATQAGRSVVLHLGDGINNITGSGVHINNGNNSVGNTQINNGSGQTGTINIGNATSGTTTTNIIGTTNIGNSGSTTTTIGVQGSTINMRGGVNINTNGTGGYSGTTIGVAGSVTAIRGTTDINTTGGGGTTIGTTNSGTSTIRGSIVNMTGTTNNITGITNINTTGDATTTIGGTGTGVITIGTATTTSTNLVGTQVNLTNPRINQPITMLYSSVLPAVGMAGLSQIGGLETYRNNGGGTGFFTTTGTTKQVYAFINSIPTGRYIVNSSLVMNTTVVSTSVSMRTVYNSNPVGFPQPLTLNQTLTLADTPAPQAIEIEGLKPNAVNKYSLNQAVVMDISSAIGNQVGLAITFGTATVGALNQFSLYLNLTITRIS